MDVDTAVTMQSATDDRWLVAIAAGALAGGDSSHALCTRAAIEGPGPGDDDDDDQGEDHDHGDDRD